MPVAMETGPTIRLGQLPTYRASRWATDRTADPEELVSVLRAASSSSTSSFIFSMPSRSKAAMMNNAPTIMSVMWRSSNRGSNANCKENTARVSPATSRTPAVAVVDTRMEGQARRQAMTLAVVDVHPGPLAPHLDLLPSAEERSRGEGKAF